MSERGNETAGESPAALQAASERRTIEAAGRNRKLAAAALNTYPEAPSPSSLTGAIS